MVKYNHAKRRSRIVHQNLRLDNLSWDLSTFSMDFLRDLIISVFFFVSSVWPAFAMAVSEFCIFYCNEVELISKSIANCVICLRSACCRPLMALAVSTNYLATIGLIVFLSLADYAPQLSVPLGVNALADDESRTSWSTYFFSSSLKSSSVIKGSSICLPGVSG